MRTPLDIDEVNGPIYVSTGICRPSSGGRVAGRGIGRLGEAPDYVPALARTPRSLFGLILPVKVGFSAVAAAFASYQ